MTQSGVYRLKFGSVETNYGTFDTFRKVGEQARLFSDISGSANRLAFELIPGKLLLDADDDLDPLFYEKYVGRFAVNGKCAVVITRSFVRLFARNTCTQIWRGLTRVSGLVWTAGDRVISDPANSQYEFDLSNKGTIDSIQIQTLDGSHKIVANRQDMSTKKAVSFKAQDGTILHGDLYTPVAEASGRATVFVHG